MGMCCIALQCSACRVCLTALMNPDVAVMSSPGLAVSHSCMAQVPGYNQQLYVARAHGDYYMLGQREAPAPDVVMQPAEEPASSSQSAEPDVDAQHSEAGKSSNSTLLTSQQWHVTSAACKLPLH